MKILRAEHLVKSYKKRCVVKDVTMSIAAGEIVGLLGPNGAGKTTCFYMIVGLLMADAGRITLDGEDLSKAPMHQRARRGIGYLPQEASVFRKLTVQQNLQAILQLRQEITDTHAATEELLREFHLLNIRNTLGISLSGGERRRVEIARALAANPTFILLDEPFAGVDPISVVDIKHIIQHLQEKGIGILITDHNVRETLDICDRAYIVAQGKVLAEGDAAAILANPLVRQVYLGSEFSL